MTVRVRTRRCLAGEFPDLDPSSAKQEPLLGFITSSSFSSSYWVSSSIEENGKSTVAAATPVAVVAHGRKTEIKTGKKVEQEEEAVKRRELLFCGAMLRNAITLKLLTRPSLVPTWSGCASFHCVALDVEGHCYTWGCNEKGQLGHGDTMQRDMPAIVSKLS
ncbi:putative E3 ubiquitin-protein ligase HERC2 [Camellia lanceoleosa]|uniref:E3 ubiquitin-protein ligase HERC2 n=1 Tax=Camellia lanceoleosa TaxID=1840588 RepID=A0ACC0FG69_9ERIC|nr:putative E3 ubiquitin-protein ligase HERC2 [Camellia lanceoleosa]